MHDEDCQLPSLDWLTDSAKRKLSTLHIPAPLLSNFSQHTKRSRIHHHNQVSFKLNLNYNQ